MAARWLIGHVQLEHLHRLSPPALPLRRTGGAPDAPGALPDPGYGLTIAPVRIGPVDKFPTPASLKKSVLS
jgi:hypothetical protein